MKEKKSFLLIIGLLLVTIFIVYAAEAFKLTFYHLYRYLYLIPILTSAYFFGMRGGIFVAVIITLIYTPPLLWDINKNKFTVENIDLAAMLFFFNGIGLTIGQIFGTLKKQRQMAQLLYEINRDISATTDYEELLNIVLNRVMSVTNARGGNLTLLNPKGEIEVRVEKKLDKEITNIQFDTQSDLWKELLMKGDPFICNNVEYDSRSGLVHKLTDTKIENYLAVPIKEKNKVIGVIEIYNKLDADNENFDNFTKENVELLNIMGNQVIIAIQNAKLMKEMVEKERLSEELRLGREIQKNLLPRDVPQVEGLRVIGFMEPAKEIGGDYYDYIVTDKGANSKWHIANGKDNKDNAVSAISHMPNALSGVAVVIGDVSGKGVAAGLIMATAKATLKGLSEQGLTPKQTLCKTNSILYEYTNGERFMTMLYLQWDSQEKKMRYSSAGHEHIIIYRSKVGSQIVDSSSEIVEKTENQSTTNYKPQSTNSPCVEVILSGGVMMGVQSEIEEYLEDNELALAPGDKVILYTDGVTEARNEQEKMYELERLTEQVKKHGHKPAEELLSSLKEDVYGFIGAAEQYDDITLVVMEYEEKS